MSQTAALSPEKQAILDKPISFTEEVVLQNFAKNAAYRFSRCARHGLYAYSYLHVADECHYTGCTSQTVAIADVAAFTEQNGVII